MTFETPCDFHAELCEICGRCHDACDCPECPECGEVGNPDCYASHGLEPAHDSIASLCRHIGVSDSIGGTLSALDRHNVEHVYLVLHAEIAGQREVYCDSKALEHLPSYTRLAAVGVAGIAWDGSDWEWAGTCAAGNGWEELDGLRQQFHEALEEHRALVEAERIEAVVYRAADGHTWRLEEGEWIAYPTHIDGTLDLENGVYLTDTYDRDPDALEKQSILRDELEAARREIDASVDPDAALELTEGAFFKHS